MSSILTAQRGVTHDASPRNLASIRRKTTYTVALVRTELNRQQGAAALRAICSESGLTQRSRNGTPGMGSIKGSRKAPFEKARMIKEVQQAVKNEGILLEASRSSSTRAIGQWINNVREIHVPSHVV